MVPPQPIGTDLKVRLEWNTGNTDFDLHLVRGNAAPFDEGNDCRYGQAHLDWGAVDDVEDDPFLDRDDTLGFGPEEINLGRGSGSYNVYVHYYGTTASVVPTSDITITYWLRGVEGSAQRTMSICGNMWHVGSINFDGGAPYFTRDDGPDAEVGTWIGLALRCP